MAHSPVPIGAPRETFDFVGIPIGLPRFRAPAGERTQDYIYNIRVAGGEPRFLEPAPEADARRQLDGLAAQSPRASPDEHQIPFF